MWRYVVSCRCCKLKVQRESAGLAVIAAQAGMMMARAASEHENLDTFAVQNQMETWDTIVLSSLKHIITRNQDFEGERLR